MAISRLSSQDAKGTSATSSVTATYPGATTSGNLLIATVFMNVTTNPAISGWTLDKATTNGTTIVTAIFSKIATGSETTVTATGGNTISRIHIHEYSGVASPIVTDGTNGNINSSGTTGTTGAITTSNANDLVVVSFGTSTGITSPGFTAPFNILQSDNRSFDGEQIVSATGTYNATASWTTSAVTVGTIAAYQAATGGGSTITATQSGIARIANNKTSTQTGAAAITNASNSLGTTSSSGTSTGGLTEILGTKYTLAAAATVSELWLYSPNSGNFTGAIYSDNAGSPDALLVSNNTGVAAVAGQYQAISITPTALTAGTYWLTFMTSANNMRGFATGGTNQAAFNLSTTYGTNFPSTFPTPSFQTQDYVAYARYTPGITVTKTQSAVARIAKTVTKTQGATANIITSGPLQSAQNEGTSPVTATFATTPGTGHLLVAFLKRNSQSGTASVSDSGTAWTEYSGSPLNYNTASSQLSVFYKLADSGQATAISSSGTGTHFLSIHEYSGNQASLTGIIDSGATATGASGTSTSGSQPSVTTTDAHAIVVSAVGLASTVTVPSWTNATMGQINQVSGALVQMVDGFQVETATGTYTPSLAWTSSRAWGQITLAFKSNAGGSVITKTQSATARVANNVTKTQGAVARVASDLTKTQSAVARVAVNTTKTQGAVARVAKIITKTQSAIARVATNPTKQQGAIARIATVRTSTQSAVARVAKTVVKTQGATANITTAGAVTKTQSATARIVMTVTKTQGPIARVANSLTKTQGSIARISITPTKTQGAVARVVQQETKTQGATARIVAPVTKTQSATARVASSLTKTQPTIARIAVIRTSTQSAVARVAKTVTKTQGATANIAGAVPHTKTQSATARIYNANIVKTPVVFLANGQLAIRLSDTVYLPV